MSEGRRKEEGGREGRGEGGREGEKEGRGKGEEREKGKGEEREGERAGRGKGGRKGREEKTGGSYIGFSTTNGPFSPHLHSNVKVWLATPPGNQQWQGNSRIECGSDLHNNHSKNVTVI